MSLLTGADTIKDSLNTLPPGLDVYASYVDNFGGYNELVAMADKLNPNGHYLSYTIFGNRANIADVEPGAMHPSDLPNWLANKGIPLPGTNLPGIYTSAGNADAVFNAVGLGGLPKGSLPDRFIFQSAHYGAGEHICGPSTCGYRRAHGTQWDDKGVHGENYDRAIWLPIFSTEPPPPPPPPEGTMNLAATRNARHHAEVFAYLDDGTVKHAWQITDTSWAGEQSGEPAGWFPLGNPGKGHAIAATLNAVGNLEVFVYLLDGSVKHTWQTDPFTWLKDKNGHVEWVALGTPGK